MNIKALKQEQYLISKKIERKLKLPYCLDRDLQIKAMASEHESIQMEINREIGEI